MSEKAEPPSPSPSAASLPPLSEPELWIGKAPMRWVYAWTASFCLNTTLNGWKHLVERPYLWFLRFLWIVVVIISLFAFAFFLTKSLEDFQNKVIVTESDTPGSWSELQFPAVTVCSLNLARKSFFKSLNLSANFEEKPFGAALLDYYYNGGDVPEDVEKEILKLITNSIKEDADKMIRLREESITMEPDSIKKGAPRAKPELIFDTYKFTMAAHQEVGSPYFLNATYQGEALAVDHFPLLHAFFRTETGFCSQVRQSFWNLGGRKSFKDIISSSRSLASTGVKLGRQNGLSLVADAEVWDYGLSREADEGFIVSVHNIGDYPITTLAQAKVGPGTNADLGITPKIEDVSEAALSRFDPEQRLCYTDDEFRFKYFLFDVYRYSFRNCMMNAARTSIDDVCGCEISAFNGGCYGNNLTCYRETISNLHQFNVSVNQLFPDSPVAKPCYSSCRDQRYNLYLSSSGFINKNRLVTDYFCMLFRKLKIVCNTPFRNESLEERYPGICEKIRHANESLCLSAAPVLAGEFLPENKPPVYNESSGVPPMWTGNDTVLIDRVFQYARENLVRINMFIRDTDLSRSVRSEKQPLIWFIANLGGLFGFAAGASMITLVEVFFFLLVLLLRCCFGIENDQFPEENGPTLEEKMMYESYLSLNAPWFDNQTDEQYASNKSKRDIQ